MASPTKKPLALPICSSPLATPLPPEPAASQGMCPDSDEELWLQELCRAPPAPAKRSLSLNSSDEAWLESICRHAPRSRSTPSPELPDGHPMPSPPPTPTTSHQFVGRVACATAKKPAPSVPPEAVEATPACPDVDWATRLAANGMPLPASTTWQLPEQDSIVWRAPDSPPAASQEGFQADLHRCLWFVLAWLRALRIAAFKIGIAFDPLDRWFNGSFGYQKEQMWQFMHVMYVGPPQSCRLLEIALISNLRSIAGCYNERPGGEGVSATSSSSAPACYCYAVYAPAGSGIGMHSSWRQRRQR